MGDASTIPESFLSPYSHTENEEKIYSKWEKSGYFKPENVPGEDREEPYTIIMPPPNANGSLHAGHALFVTLQDMMVRYQRMRGKRTLWVPGADHAGFETQVVYEKKLGKEGRSRFGLSPEDLYAEILTFTQENRKNMENQLRTLGASCDWSRAMFTLDDRVKKQVYETFEKMEKDKLLYRGLRSVHWCPKHQTGLSDLEVEHVERVSPFYYLQYGPFIIGTVRPETKFSDKYIVVHPDDERYATYTHGQQITVNWIQGEIKATVIKDIAGDPERGTGAMTITPWHSAIDWEIAQRHGLEYEQIISEKGKMLPVAGECADMNITEAREKIVEKMKKMGLLVRVDKNYTHTVSVCYKCKREIEPQLKQQWFVSTKPLAKETISAIKKDKVRFITDRHRRVALHWLSQIKDWNISRQIVWGIPIPAKICTQCDHGMVDSKDQITQCTKCGGETRKDTDTFDTWFSSGQWPFIVLGYPDKEDYKKYYPTNMMESGNDILFFWVVRMLMLGLYRTGVMPFKEVYLHGMVRDSKKEKMSKSKGNVIDPINVAKEYGTDAMRMAYIVGNIPGEHINFSTDKIRGYKKFANKIWNIGRFVLTETKDCTYSTDFLPEDRQHVDECNKLLQKITDDMEHHRYHLAAEKLYHYVWHTIADDIIEKSKEILTKGDQKKKTSKQSLLLYLYATSLKALHPFMPFITEVIWQHMPEGEYKKQSLLMVERWPKKDTKR